MKIFGYAVGDPSELVTLAEVTIQATPETLRALAQFFEECANRIEGDVEWEHDHFSDQPHGIATEADIVVFKAEA